MVGLVHARLLPQSPKDSSVRLCLFCCLAYRVIITIFLNSIYMHPGEKARSWEALGKARPGQSSLSAGALRYRDPWVRKMPWRRKWQPTSLFLPKESHGQRSLVDY